MSNNFYIMTVCIYFIIFNIYINLLQVKYQNAFKFIISQIRQQHIVFCTVYHDPLYQFRGVVLKVLLMELLYSYPVATFLLSSVVFFCTWCLTLLQLLNCFILIIHMNCTYWIFSYLGLTWHLYIFDICRVSQNIYYIKLSLHYWKY